MLEMAGWIFRRMVPRNNEVLMSVDRLNMTRCDDVLFIPLWFEPLDPWVLYIALLCFSPWNSLEVGKMWDDNVDVGNAFHQLTSPGAVQVWKPRERRISCCWALSPWRKTWTSLERSTSRCRWANLRRSEKIWVDRSEKIWEDRSRSRPILNTALPTLQRFNEDRCSVGAKVSPVQCVWMRCAGSALCSAKPQAAGMAQSSESPEWHSRSSRSGKWAICRQAEMTQMAHASAIICHHLHSFAIICHGRAWPILSHMLGHSMPWPRNARKVEKAWRAEVQRRVCRLFVKLIITYCNLYLASLPWDSVDLFHLDFVLEPMR